MRILLACHGYPPELVGGTENSVQALARGLARRGHEVLVAAGTIDSSRGFARSEEWDADPGSGERLRVVRLHRGDLYYEHWHKSACPQVGRAFAELVREIQPDVVHVHHWLRLTRDLVALAAREGVPSVVSLHDTWITCLLTFRVRAGTSEFCEAPLAPSPCLGCAAEHPPFTPWVPLESAHLAIHQHRAELLRELELARAVVVPSRAHAALVERLLGREPGWLGAHAVPPGRNLDLERREPPAEPGPGPLVVGSWGHLNALKGADLLVDALGRLPAPARVELRLAGGEADRIYVEGLKRSARDLPVSFLGEFDAETLDRHPVSAGHLMASATRAHESWGLVLDEALCLGLPVLLPRSGALAERCEGRPWALLFEPGDAGDLARQLQRLLDEPGLLASLRAGLPAREGVARTLDASLDALEGVYGAAVAAGAPQVGPAQWWTDGLRERELADWDRRLSECPPAELGFS